MFAFVLLLVVSITTPLTHFYTALSASYTWTQTDWSGGITANGALHPGDQSDWDEFSVQDVKNNISLPTSLVSYYELEETSGERADSHGSDTLTDNNTVTSGTGIQGDAAVFVSTNSEYLSDTTHSAPTGGNPRSFSCWVKSSTNSEQSILSYGTSVSAGEFTWSFNENLMGLRTSGQNIFYTAL